MKKVSHLFILVAVFVALTTGTVWAQTTLHVDDDGVQWPGAYTTISAALTVAANGYTIIVHEGTYIENVVINKSLSLIGAGNTTTIIDGNIDGNDDGNAVTITASNVTVSGFTVTGGWSDPDSGTGVFHPDGGVVVDGNGGSSALTGITIEGNIIYNNDGNGVYVSAAGHGGASDNIVVRNNDVYSNGGSKGYAGISLTTPNYIVRDLWDIDEWRRPKNILIEGNNVYDNDNYGVYVSAGRDNVIMSNSIHNNVKYGLQLASSWNRTDIPCEFTTVEDNEIYDNTRNGVKLTSWNQYNTFTGNNIYDNGFNLKSDRYKYGFLFQDGNNNTIQNNTITGNSLGGLYLWGKGDPSYTWYSTTDNTITGNTISNHAALGGHGIFMPDKSRPDPVSPYPILPDGYPNSGFLNSYIDCNNIENNSYGLKNLDTTQTVDATNNWWGDALGPSGFGPGFGDAVSDYVDYDPWLEAPCPPPALAVLIDIKPGSDQNKITLSSAGLISVAILSSATFNATTVNPETVRFAGVGIKMVGKSNKYLSHERDVNNDGLLDLVCQILTENWTIQPGQTIAELEAATYDGQSIRGGDFISIVPDN